MSECYLKTDLKHSVTLHLKPTGKWSHIMISLTNLSGRHLEKDSVTHVGLGDNAEYKMYNYNIPVLLIALNYIFY